jgi:hypothetical protein
MVRVIIVIEGRDWDGDSLVVVVTDTTSPSDREGSAKMAGDLEEL